MCRQDFTVACHAVVPLSNFSVTDDLGLSLSPLPPPSSILIQSSAESCLISVCFAEVQLSDVRFARVLFLPYGHVYLLLWDWFGDSSIESGTKLLQQ